VLLPIPNNPKRRRIWIWNEQLVEILRILLGRFLVRRKYGSQVRDQGEVNSDESAEKGDKRHSRRLRWKHIFIVMGKYKFWPRKLFTSFMKIARLDDCVRVFELDWLQNVSNLSFATYENCDLKVRKFHHKITKFCYEMFISRCQKAKNIVKYASVIATRVIFVKDAYLL
jgi:hypothetical protein